MTTGTRVGCKRVARLLRAAHLAGVHRRRHTTVARDVRAMAPDRLWVGALTDVPADSSSA